MTVTSIETPALIKGRLPILWITRTVPCDPAAGGSDVYSEGLIHSLARAGADVTVLGISPIDDASLGRLTEVPTRFGSEGGALSYEAVKVGMRRVLPALVGRLPLVAARVSPRALRKRLRVILAGRTFKVVVIDNYAAGWALDELLGRCVPQVPLIYVAHNDEAALSRDIARAFPGSILRKMALWLNARKIRVLEDRILQQVGGAVALTEGDRVSLERRGGNICWLVAPPGYSGPKRSSRLITRVTPRRVVVLGSVKWIAKQMNVASLLSVADQRFAAAGITLDIIGDIPESFRAEWQGRLKATRLRGFVDDIQSDLNDARVGLVVEPTGGGFKMKTLDYVFNRVPTVVLQGSCAGLPSSVADAFLSYPDMTHLVDGVVSIIDDLPRLNMMQNAAFAEAEHRFNWDTNGALIAGLVRTLAYPASEVNLSSHDLVLSHRDGESPARIRHAG